DIREIDLEGSDSHVFFGQTVPKPDTTAGEPVNWRVRAAAIRIANTDFAFRDANQPRIPNGFDYGNMGITGLAGELTDLYYSTDTIRGRLDNVQASDHSGFTLNRLQAAFSYTGQGAELSDLYAETPHTLVRDYIKVSYPSLETAMEQLETIELAADIKESHLGMEDVLYFVPDLDTMELMEPLWTHTIYINTEISGRLDDLRIPRLELQALDKTRIVADAHIRG